MARPAPDSTIMKRLPRSAARIDWLLFYLRWPLLLVIAAELFFAPVGKSVDLIPAAVVLGLAALYNLAILLLLLGGAWFTAFPVVSVVVDSALAVALFYVSGGSVNVMQWAALFPAVSASLRYGWPQGLISAGTIVVADLVLMMVAFPELYEAPIPFAIRAALLIVGTLLTGLMGQRVMLLAIKRTHAERDVEQKRVKNIREQAHIIYEMASLVSATLNYERVLDAALDLSATSIADTGAASAQLVSAVLLFNDNRLRVITARRFTPNDLKVLLPAQSGVLAEAIGNGEPTFSAEPFRDQELSQVVALRSCRAVMVVPLQAGLDTYGVMLFAHPRPNFFDIDHVEILEAICKHTVIAIQNAKLYQKLLNEKERIVQVEEDARKKLARDLHDGPTQSVAAIAMRANYIRRLLDREPKSAAEELYKVEELARRTTKEIRHMLFTLRPLVLESQGLVAALQALADKMHENYNLNVIIEPQGDAAEQLDIHAQGVLFYIVEEAVGNARKHAEAEHIWVRLKLHAPDIFLLEIHDDGVGFDVGAVDASYDKRGSLGMVNMRERTELVNGVLQIDSAVGRGTRVNVLVPLTDEAREKLGS